MATKVATAAGGFNPLGRFPEAGDDADGCWAVVGKFVAWLVVTPLVVVVKVGAVASLWGWFLTPATGLAVPAYWQVYGLLVLVGLLFARIPARNDTAEEEALKYGGVERSIMAVLFFGAGWFVGWGVKTYGPLFG